MREIKFDAIYKPTGEHFKPRDINFNDNTITGKFDGKAIDWCHFSLDGKRGDVILRQYTGLQDSKGKDIYEGDVVTLTVPDEEYVIEGQGYLDVGIENGFSSKGEVKFLYNGWFIDEGEGKGCPLDWTGSQNIEIHGNIYEHRHLLEVRE